MFHFSNDSVHVLHTQDMKMANTPCLVGTRFLDVPAKKMRINAFKSFKDYPFPGKVANLKILFRQRYLSAAP